MNKRTFHRVTIITLVSIAALTGGCRSTPTAIGRSSFEFVESVALHAPSVSVATGGTAEADTTTTITRVDLVPAHPRKSLAPPIYPRAALAARAKDCVVCATVDVSETGEIAGVRRSLADPSALHPQGELFFAAVRQAVVTWDLAPAHEDYYERTSAGGIRKAFSRPLATRAEVKFVFESNGTVR